MRTKTLLLTAALSAAGIVSSMAQAGAVYSVNAVGYVNTTLKPGYNLVSNPLIAADNKISTLFTGVPNQTQVYKFNGTGFTTATYSTILGGWNPPAAADQTVVPGEGVFVRNPTAADITVTFVGEVPQGPASNTTIPAGLSIKSSTVPQSGTAAELGFPAANQDQIYQFNPVTQKYSTSTYSTILGGWNPALGTLNVGEAIFVRKNVAAAWDRNFSVNQ
jgi:hypothetical protein